jgi:plastocyanin
MLYSMTSLVRVATVGIVGIAVLLLAGCGTSSSSGSAAAPATTPAATSSPASGAQISISSFTFKTPATVKAGQKLTVTNSDGVEHTVTSDDGKSFNVTVAAGGTATFTAPAKPGTYPFHCSVHPQMHGTLVVKP